MYAYVCICICVILEQFEYTAIYMYASLRFRVTRTVTAPRKRFLPLGKTANNSDLAAENSTRATLKRLLAQASSTHKHPSTG